MTLEIIKRLFAIIALVESLACGGAELAKQPRVGGMTLRAGNNLCCSIHGVLWWRNTVSFQLLFTGLAHPVGGPGG